MDKSAASLDPLALLAFAEVADAGSFSGAARATGRSRQSLHRQISEFEEQLGVRLLERSTRSLRVTDIGRRLLVHANQLRGAIRSATHEMNSAQAEPSGTFRVAAPDLLGRVFLAPVISKFLERYPEVRLETVFALDRVDLIADRFDVAVRPGRLDDSGLLTKPLGRAVVVCCASPGYLQRAPRLSDPGELSRHSTLHYGSARPGDEIQWMSCDLDVRVRPRLISTSPETIRRAAIDGLGVARLPLVACAEAIAAGTLVEVLEPWRNDETPITAVFASHSVANPTLAAFLAMLENAASATDWLTQ